MLVTGETWSATIEAWLMTQRSGPSALAGDSGSRLVRSRSVSPRAEVPKRPCPPQNPRLQHLMPLLLKLTLPQSSLVTTQ